MLSDIICCMRSLDDKIISRIKNLRREGFSIPEISRKLGCSKSTALRYAKSVIISPSHYERWLNRRNASKIISENNWINAYRKAESRIGSITDRDLALVAASLYWAEGAKKDFTFSNTDADMIRVFIRILKKVFGVIDQDIKISLRIYEDLDKNVCLKYWSGITGIKLDKNTSVDILFGKKKGKLQYGMCRIRIRKGGLLLKEFYAMKRQLSVLI